MDAIAFVLWLELVSIAALIIALLTPPWGMP